MATISKPISATMTLGEKLRVKVDARENRPAINPKKPVLTVVLEKVDENKLRFAVIEQDESLRCRYDEDWYVCFKHGPVTISSDECPKIKRIGNSIQVSIRGCDRAHDAQIHVQQFSDELVRDLTHDAVLRALESFCEGGYFHRGSKPVLVLKRQWDPLAVHSYY